MSVLLSRIPGRPGRLLSQGYRFLSQECDRAAGNVAQFRLLGVPVTVLRGADAARIFYSERLRRHGANPGLLRKTLVGQGTVQGLDGPVHRHRKAMFLSLLAPDRAEDLAEEFVRQWRHRLPSWELQQQVVLLEEVGEVLCAAVCRWAGVPLLERDVRRRTLQLRALIEGPGSVARRQWRGRMARIRLERWLGTLIEQARESAQSTSEAPARAAASASVLEVIATYRDPDGTLLDARTAAAELLNVLRPVVAIERFIVFTALALHDHPEWRERLADGDHGSVGDRSDSGRSDGGFRDGSDGGSGSDSRARSDADVERFVQEVRRYYPFFPAVAAKAAETFTVAGRLVPKGQRVILDLYGTDHLETDRGGLWEDPERFDPDRFRGGEPDPFGFIPQGGGDFATGHRCAGEWTVLAVMRSAARLLTTDMSYGVPPQDLTVRMNRAPAIPESRFVITDIHQADRRAALVGADI